MLKDSGLIEAGRPGSTVRVQDAYSLRCTPQVHGAARDTVEYAASVAGVELASAIDNPCVIPTASLTWRATAACRRSWLVTRAWTPVS